MTNPTPAAFTADIIERTVVVTWPDNDNGGATPPPDGWQERAWDQRTLHEIDEGSVSGCSILRWRDDPRSDDALVALSLALVTGKPAAAAVPAPAPTDRAAVLREAAERYERLLDDMGDDKAKDPRYWQGVQHVTVGLRRLADAASGPGGAAGETQQAETQAACPHCPDGHTPSTAGSQPWSAWVASERDGDGQPMQITVARSAGAHVAESDAQWIRSVLNGRAVAPTSDLPLDHPLRRECRCSEAGVCRRCLERPSARAWPAAPTSSGGFTGISLAGRWECGNCGASGDGWYDEDDGLVLHDENGQPITTDEHDCGED